MMCVYVYKLMLHVHVHTEGLFYNQCFKSACVIKEREAIQAHWKF